LLMKLRTIKEQVKRFHQEQRGDLGAAAWIIGSVVIVVAIILVIKALAPDTATSLWNTVWTWVQNQFGIN